MNEMHREVENGRWVVFEGRVIVYGIRSDTSHSCLTCTVVESTSAILIRPRSLVVIHAMYDIYMLFSIDKLPALLLSSCSWTLMESKRSFRF